MRRRLVAVAVAGAMLAFGVAAASASGGNPLSVLLCQGNGWQTLQSSSGGSFPSQSACASYVAGGGTLFAPKVTATNLGCNLPSQPGVDVWMLVASGFTPDSSLTATIGSASGVFPRPFDDFGAIIIHVLAAQGSPATPVALVDANGVHASVTVGPFNCTAGGPPAPTVTATDLGCYVPAHQGIDIWMLVGSGFAPNSPVTLDISTVGSGLFSRPFDEFGSIIIHVLSGPVVVPAVTATLTDNTAAHASVTFGPTVDCSDLAGVNLKNADLTGANLAGENFKGANLQGANLQTANLQGGNLQGANLQSDTLSGANLGGANLEGANLQGDKLNNANLAGANLDGANLQGADLTAATLADATVKGTNLNKITWSNTICPDGTNSTTDGGTCLKNLQ